MTRASPVKRATALKSLTTASTASRTRLSAMSSWNSSSSTSFCRKSRFSTSRTSASLNSSAGNASRGTPARARGPFSTGVAAHPRAVLSRASAESAAKPETETPETPSRSFVARGAGFGSIRRVRGTLRPDFSRGQHGVDVHALVPEPRERVLGAERGGGDDERPPAGPRRRRLQNFHERLFLVSKRAASSLEPFSRGASVCLPASCSSSRSARSNLRRTRSASPNGVSPALFRARASAPASSNAAIDSASAMRAARVSGVSSRWSGGSTHVPGRDASARTTRARPCIAAKCRGARPSASSSFASTPCEHRSSTTSACPRAAANVIGRTPALSIASNVAPPAMSAATSSVRPRSHAVRSASARRRSSSASARRASIAAVRVDARVPAPRALALRRGAPVSRLERNFPGRARSSFGTRLMRNEYAHRTNRSVTTLGTPRGSGSGSFLAARSSARPRRAARASPFRPGEGPRRS